MSSSKPRSQAERTLSLADRFIEEIRRDVEEGAGRGVDMPPCLRSIHERPGHASPEYRTQTIRLPEEGVEDFPTYLSGVIARYASEKRPDRLLLAVEAVQGEGTVVIAEARDGHGTRRFRRESYRLEGRRVSWEKPAPEMWHDPGDEEMILDSAFRRLGREDP